MLIVNPIYDQAFKYLMDNETIAKKVISIILEKKVHKIQPKPQEIKLIDKKHNIPLSRFDFKAVIEDENGEINNILIEIQKSNKPDPILRFRRYLGKNYIRTETFINEQGQEEDRALPIITIYILGYKLEEYDTPGLLVNNQVIDATTKKIYTVKNDFVKLLTHPSYIIQTKRLRPERRTKLEEFLVFFDQTKKTEDKYLLNIDEISEDEDINSIALYLNRGTLDEELLLQLEFEEDIDREFDKMEDELEHVKKEKAEAQKREAEAMKEKAEAQKREAEAIREKQEFQNKTAKELKAVGISIVQISEITGLSVEEIEKL